MLWLLPGTAGRARGGGPLLVCSAAALDVAAFSYPADQRVSAWLREGPPQACIVQRAGSVVPCNRFRGGFYPQWCSVEGALVIVTAGDDVARGVRLT